MIRIFLFLCVLLACGASAVFGSDERLFHVQVELPPSMESRSVEFEQLFRSARRRLTTFASAYGWTEQVRHPFISRALIFDLREAFHASLRSRFQMKPSAVIPAAYAAVIRDGVFLAVSPELYAEQYRDRPEQDFYEKLICHELVHELHIRILHYNEDAMGPLWFYEGFAVYGSGQFEDSLPLLSDREIWSIVKSTKRMSYRSYGAIIRYFLTYVTLQEMVERAGGKDFTQWLKRIQGTPSLINSFHQGRCPLAYVESDRSVE
jgi:hypothetical protein